MSKHVLITGGTGLVGKQLTEYLLSKGYTVSHLSRKPGTDARVATYLWDVKKGEIDEHCIDGVDTIVHLAGNGIADERWTEERKKEIIESRTKSIALVYEVLKKNPHNVKTVVSASGVGYYSDRGNDVMTETCAPAHDFMGTCCVAWENAVAEGEKLGLRVVKFRTGVVLSKVGGALPKIAAPVKFGVGAALGSGKQWMPWIHEQDVVYMYRFAIDHEELSGVFNMVAPEPVTNKQFTKAITKVLSRPFWLPNVPAFALKLALGEMATIVLGSTNASAKKIKAAGYSFSYPELTGALKDIYRK
ncbi:TIGR01777 family oxidoreductase [Mucilaginibacter calamicampi]|uniref:TIGR01777 family oxidoreductase n=1 Tax=Mucilaginibacter calamicampi TaxID=1302352 RepID=A0ABW2YQL8_9SPHI